MKGTPTGAMLGTLLVLGSCALAVSAWGAVRDGNELVSVASAVSADSVTVGERFRVKHVFTFPDTLEMLPSPPAPPGRTRVLDTSWRDAASAPGSVERTRELLAITLDLAQAVLPPQVVYFSSASGDTFRVQLDEVIVPVRHLAAQSKDLKPLKSQWEAPRSYTAWIIAAAAAVALAVLAWFLWRRRRRRVVMPAPAPALPPDTVALAELTRIERMGLLERDEYKRYYTLVVDAVRRYVESRFGVEAMDRTTRELLDDMSAHGHIDGLETLLTEADLVKFAKFLPSRAAGEKALESARDIVVSTTPKAAPDEPAERAAAVR